MNKQQSKDRIVDATKKLEQAEENLAQARIDLTEANRNLDNCREVTPNMIRSGMVLSRIPFKHQGVLIIRIQDHNLEGEEWIIVNSDNSDSSIPLYSEFKAERRSFDEMYEFVSSHVNNGGKILGYLPKASDIHLLTFDQFRSR